MISKPSKYDWTLWDRESIQAMVRMIKADIVDQNLTIDQFHSIVTRHVKKWMPVRVSKSREEQVDSTYVWVGGCYHTDYDWQRKKSIELSFAYSPLDRRICFNTRKFNRLCTRIADVVLHEVIHMRQARKRKFKEIPGFSSTAQSTKLKEQQEYFGDADEVDAYAFNMACELNDKFDGNMRNIVAYLNKKQRRYHKNWDTWCSYLKAFNWDTNHRIIRKIKKRSIYYLSRAQVSRPFQPKDWIQR